MSRHTIIRDCHAHVIDPARSPYVDGPGYPPAAARDRGRGKLFGAVLVCARREAHALLVQPSCYGTDNSCDAGRRWRRAPGRFKAIAVVADRHDRQGAGWPLAARGVVGVRFNLVNLPPAMRSPASASARPARPAQGGGPWPAQIYGA